MTQQEDDNKSLRNFSSSTSCLNWQEWTHFSQHGRWKGRASIQAGSNLPWNNTSSKTNPSPLLLERLQCLESTRTEFLSFNSRWNLTSEVTPGYFRLQQRSLDLPKQHEQFRNFVQGAELPLGPGFRIFHLHYVCLDQREAREMHQTHSPNLKKPEINQIWHGFPLLSALCPLT